MAADPEGTQRMGVVLTASAVWCALSVLFAGAHSRWVYYAPAWAPPTPRVSMPGAFAEGPDPWVPEGTEVSAFFAGYAPR